MLLLSEVLGILAGFFGLLIAIPSLVTTAFSIFVALFSKNTSKDLVPYVIKLTLALGIPAAIIGGLGLAGGILATKDPIKSAYLQLSACAIVTFILLWLAIADRQYFQLYRLWWAIWPVTLLLGGLAALIGA